MSRPNNCYALESDARRRGWNAPDRLFGARPTRRALPIPRLSRLAPEAVRRNILYTPGPGQLGQLAAKTSSTSRICPETGAGGVVVVVRRHGVGGSHLGPLAALGQTAVGGQVGTR
jgi:hypothetical protein